MVKLWWKYLGNIHLQSHFLGQTYEVDCVFEIIDFLMANNLSQAISTSIKNTLNSKLHLTHTVDSTWRGKRWEVRVKWGSDDHSSRRRSPYALLRRGRVHPDQRETGPSAGFPPLSPRCSTPHPPGLRAPLPTPRSYAKTNAMRKNYSKLGHYDSSPKSLKSKHFKSFL